MCKIAESMRKEEEQREGQSRKLKASARVVVGRQGNDVNAQLAYAMRRRWLRPIDANEKLIGDLY